MITESDTCRILKAFYWIIKVKEPEISTISAADDPEDDQIDLNDVYEYGPKTLDVKTIEKVEKTKIGISWWESRLLQTKLNCWISR